MRSPEHRNTYNRTGHTQDEVSSRHKAPGAFTILPPDDAAPQDPPMAPQPYRLTPSSRRHKNMSFAILAEPSSLPTSRSPSPTGRVSPFRGRGFNPIGSRHASPAPSPPPQGAFTLQESPSHSKIPRLSRRGSAAAFGEKITDYQSSPNRRKLNAQLSQSLTNIAPRRVTARPPPSPRRPPGYSKNTFQRLSPIVGSSPEPSQSQSSPKLNTSSTVSKSRSFVNRPPRNASKPTSKATSREPSPSKNPASPTRIPVKNYRNVQAKVNSFSRTKPKVPPKPQVLSETDSDSVANRRKVERKESVSRLRTNSRINLNLNNNNNTKNNNKNNKNNVGKDTNGNQKSNNNNNNKNAVTNKGAESSKEKNETKATNDKGNNKKEDSTKKNEAKEETAKKSEKESPVKLSDLLQPSTTAVVSSTTTTVTQPLKIEAKIEEPAKTDNKMAPMVDGRILSATSVSHAMNKMNDTVLDSQTLMKESGLTKLSPAASTIIAMSNQNPLDTKNATTALPKVEEATTKTVDSINSNHVTSTGIVPARVLEQHVQNNMSKLISPDHKIGNSVQKTANDRIIEARTVVAHDVKPIKITVREKPMDVEVQSGNIRFDTSNGLGERPGLPPPQQPNDSQEPQEPPKGNACTRFLSTCKKKMSCKRCKKQKDETKDELKKEREETGKTGCFNCRKKKPDVTINIENDEPKPKFWDRMKCCKRNKVGDTGCFPTGKRKESWVGERRDSILSDPPTVQKSRCSGFFRRMFCLDKCRKKTPPKIEETQESRRASMMSKKKSLTPSVPVEDTKPKLDLSLVEHTSHMKAAIPVLPVCLAWFCLVMNCIAPGTGTVFSGMFCLCIGKPRFSQKDGPRPRIGAFIIDLIIGFGQFFTVLFCLVGWGWSIWWGVIMVKLAKKNKKIKALEANAQEGSRQVPAANQNHRDPERGS
ncbi:protein stum [Tribolium castaneum]|uniref:protein stum n=1 Tax=Tribolium castaneum TaxID=7070 RepID=UPI00077DE3E2|nr:PREDICTED: protein stum [Tribolium castaneum]|eukprot:XP_015833524.1 PREDICTED: protein stum [Tribolium castaneum]